jgi:hypothetical protein
VNQQHGPNDDQTNEKGTAGTRLFPGTGPGHGARMVASRATRSGVTIQVYRPTGRPQYGTDTVDGST